MDRVGGISGVGGPAWAWLRHAPALATPVLQAVPPADRATPPAFSTYLERSNQRAVDPPPMWVTLERASVRPEASGSLSGCPEARDREPSLGACRPRPDVPCPGPRGERSPVDPLWRLRVAGSAQMPRDPSPGSGPGPMVVAPAAAQRPPVYVPVRGWGFEFLG